MPIISLSDWAGQDSGLTPTPQGTSSQLLKALMQGIGTFMKTKQDKLYRQAVAKAMGIPEEQVPMGMGQEMLPDILKEKFKAQLTPREWKPTTREEALGFEKEKAGITETKDLTKKLETFRDLSAKKGWELSVAPGLPPGKQTEIARKLFTAKMAEPKEPMITPSTAIGILADPIKSAQIKRMYPEFYKRLEEIAKTATGAEIPIEPSGGGILDENW